MYDFDVMNLMFYFDGVYIIEFMCYSVEWFTSIARAVTAEYNIMFFNCMDDCKLEDLFELVVDVFYMILNV